MHSLRTPCAAGLVAVTLFLVPACQTAPRSGATTVPLYAGFSGYHRAVTTVSPDAQRWFDQGLQLLYGFNHDEAIRSFQQAAVLDPACAMAWWGVAYANGLHINNPAMTEHQSRAGWEAAQEAVRRLDAETPVEHALVRAVAQRYAWPVPAERRPLDVAFAAAMESAWRAYPNDPDVGAIFAESLMNLQPWDLWTDDGEPKGRAEEIVAVIETVLAMRPDHPGANHFYIHAVEASRTPDRALEVADRLGGLVPGSGHLVHMPSHVYIRVGRYADAADVNERAIRVDKEFFSIAPAPAFYGLYIVHNFHFLAYAAMMEGRYETALAAARELERDIPPHFLDEFLKVADAFMTTSRHVMIRFGRWDELLALPAPPDARLYSRAIHHYARGVALSALDRPADAHRELDAFNRAAAEVTAEWLVGNNTGPDVLGVARTMLQGEIMFREGKHDEAFARLREGAALEDALRYDEPPAWMQPVRHALGALLLADGRAEEAESVYRADLGHNRRNGWALLGLEQALRQRGARQEEIVRAATARAQVWRRADVEPTSSCYCQP